MSQAAADRNLLFGVLAFQMDFVSREQLLAAMQAWVFDKSKSLGDILSSQKVLADDNRQLLEALVEKHISIHGGDAQKSLASVSSVGSVKNELNQINDEFLQASVTLVGAKPGAEDPYRTIDSAAPTLTPGGVRFRILRPHAKGGLGEVFVARDEELHREVALKEIQLRQADNRDSRSRFMLEAEITGGLEHPGIVPVYGLGTYADGRPYYAMRFIRGDSLKDAIDRFHKELKAGMDAGLRTLEERRLLGRFIDVCDAIAYAHSRGVLHRDLKPGNIMLGKYGETLVVDWGLAKPLGISTELGGGPSEPGEGSLVPSSLSAGSATLAGSALGTPQYMSPEQAAGKIDQLGPAADVYSLGATLYCLLAGRPPIIEGSLGEVLQKVQRGQIPRLRDVKPDVHPALDAICMKALALNPQDRYASPRGISVDLEHWLGDEPVSAWTEPWPVRARRWMKKHRTLVTGVAAAVMVAFVGFVVTTILLSAANERERQAKLKAEHNFQLAQDAVNRYLTEVSENVILHEPGMEPLRKKLLQAAKEYYTQFLKERGGDPTIRTELARATFRLAQITGDIGSELDAIKLHEEAVHLFGDPADTAGQADLATTYHHLGRLYRLTDKLAKSEEAYGKALKIWEKVTEESKDDAYLAGLARSQLGLGNEYQLTRRLDDAEKLYRKALATRVALAKANPKTAALQREVALTHHQLGLVFKYIAGREPEAVKEFRAAIAIQKAIAEDAPHVSQYQQDLARSYANLADFSGPADQEKALTIRRTLVQRHPEVAAFQTNLAATLWELGSNYARVGEFKKAEEPAAEAVKIERKLCEKHPGVGNYQGDLGRALFELGEVNRFAGDFDKAKAAYDEAIERLTKPATDLPKPPHYRHALAKTWNALGFLYSNSKKGNDANAAYHKALTLWDKLVQDHPNENEFAIGRAGTCVNLGNWAKAAGNVKDALAWYTRGLDSIDARERRLPQSAAVKVALGRAHWLRADTLLKDGRAAESLADWDRAVELAETKHRGFLQLDRLTALARSGKHQEAANEAGPLLPKAQAGAALVRFAAIYAAAATAAENDVAQSAEKRQALAEPLAAQALKLLEDARATGYFKSQANRERLLADPDLQRLQERPEFKKLLTKVH